MNHEDLQRASLTPFVVTSDFGTDKGRRQTAQHRTASGYTADRSGKGSTVVLAMLQGRTKGLQR